MRFEQAVADVGVLQAGDLERVASEVGDLVEQAVRFAESSPMPDLSELETDVYTPARQGV
jgi:TPP-dependent pyruvate/acetoin dehydrogenase alpha subunit